eukprot:scaffold42596_cov163-Isochrysis_galbana.AAC.1
MTRARCATALRCGWRGLYPGERYDEYDAPPRLPPGVDGLYVEKEKGSARRGGRGGRGGGIAAAAGMARRKQKNLK